MGQAYHLIIQIGKRPEYSPNIRRCNNGLDCFGAVKYVEKLLGTAKTGCIDPPEYLVAPQRMDRILII